MKQKNLSLIPGTSPAFQKETERDSLEIVITESKNYDKRKH